MGIFLSHICTQVNGQSLEGMTIETVRNLIVGPAGTDVHLLLMRNEGGRYVFFSIPI
jgi:C-terminal processing protease CtpA/Prc